MAELNGTAPRPGPSPWDDQGPCAGADCEARITRYGRKANGTLCPDCRAKVEAERGKR